tara:strand:- start:29 stop:463 length:435 start_codon:yes stop_codon:yes gene_type:complete
MKYKIEKNVPINRHCDYDREDGREDENELDFMLDMKPGESVFIFLDDWEMKFAKYYKEKSDRKTSRDSGIYFYKESQRKKQARISKFLRDKIRSIYGNDANVSTFFMARIEYERENDSPKIIKYGHRWHCIKKVNKDFWSKLKN